MSDRSPPTPESPHKDAEIAQAIKKLALALLSYRLRQIAVSADVDEMALQSQALLRTLRGQSPRSGGSSR